LNAIFIFDLHNTLYDEIIEYGGAVAAAVKNFLRTAESQGCRIDEQVLCGELAGAHARIGSDWDDDVWYDIPSLKKLANRDAVIRQSIALRRNASEGLTRETAFSDTLAAIAELKKTDASVYVATEATQNAASDAIRWLGLDGVLDGAYAWPFRKTYRKPAKTPVRAFPSDPAQPALSLQKPHPLIIGAIMLDIAKADGRVPQQTTPQEAFDFRIDDKLDVSSLQKAIDANRPGRSDNQSTQQIQANEILRAIQTRLVIRQGPYRDILNEIKSRCFYIGDSFFKDGFLARNAGVPFIFAQYGKSVAEQDKAAHMKGKEWLYRVTGWDKFIIQLTQEAGRLPELTDNIKPCFVCNQSFREFTDALKAQPRQAAE
jgi:phosphoglycolate phosphatase-like HAD superfamily hydrolase